MNRNCHWVPFVSDHIDEASRVLAEVRNESLRRELPDSDFAESEAIETIRLELKKDVAAAYLLTDGSKVVGYAVATVTDDTFFGRSGWLRPGAFALLPGYDDALPELYARIGQSWLDRGLLEHCIFVPAPGGNLSEAWSNLGFAKQQTHAVLNLQKRQDASESKPSPDINVRPARTADAEEISSFSRCIASYQATGPCFAPVPDAFLEALDKGYRELTEDDEAEILVAEIEGRLAGLAILYPITTVGFLMPANGAELSVAAVKPEYRGTGVGTALTHGILADQRERGRHCIETDWRCANPLSSRFWPRMGFQPVGHRLIRRLDSLCLV